MANELLSIQNITKTYFVSKKITNEPVLKGIHFSLKQGERVGVTGPSGCGKTTLLRLIAGLEEPDSGKILINERLATDQSIILPPHRRGIGFVFQTPALWPHMTVAENIGYPAKDNQVKLEELLEDFEISDLANRLPSQISGGQAKRVAIARALASGAQLFLMDEPLTSLDQRLQSHILEIVMRYLNRTNSGLIYVTHEGKELASIISRHYRIEGGVLYDAK